MYTLKIQNSRNEVYDLTHDARFIVTSADGITYPQNAVNLIEDQEDGFLFCSGHMQARNILITVVLCGDIEASRIALYRVFPPKSEVTVFYKNKIRDVMISGIVEQVDGSLFTQLQTMQVSIICPDPYWRDANAVETETGYELPLFSFAFAMPEEGEPVSEQYDHPVCSIVNTGDVKTGFECVLTVDSGGDPTVTLTTVTGDSADYIASHQWMMTPADNFFGAYDPDAQALNIYVSGLYKAEDTYSRKILTFSDSTPVSLFLDFTQGTFYNSTTVLAEILTGGGLTDLMYFVGAEYRVNDPSQFLEFYLQVNDGFNVEKDKLRLYRYDMVTQETAEITEYTINDVVQRDGGTYVDISVPVYVNSHAVLWHAETYWSRGGVDVRALTITRQTLQNVTYADGRSRNSVFKTADFPAYDPSVDRRLVLEGAAYLPETNYVIRTATDADDVAYTIVTKSSAIQKTISFVFAKSTIGEDIHTYTWQQIMACLGIVSGVTITNSTTGERMQFTDTVFKNGDVIGISTVHGDLYARVIESSWLIPGESLLHDIARNGTFFRLKQGINVIEITSDANVDFLSAVFRTRMLYGGA